MFEHRYGYRSEFELNDLELESVCFREGRTVEQGGLGKAGHFRRIVEMAWPAGGRMGFVWHPWAEWSVRELCKWPYLSIHGCGASGKSALLAIWAIVNWLCAPTQTVVMVTSTSLKESRRRIWGYIVDYFAACPWLPGDLLDSEGVIRTKCGDARASQRSGIALIAGDKRKEKDAVGKIIGAHNDRVFFLADEMTELSPAIIEAAIGNMAINPEFQLVGLGNFASYYDPLGTFSEPVDGWASITPQTYEWKTKLGYCIRLDGLQSPNMLTGENKYPFLYGPKHYEEHINRYGENSAGFWRFCRSYPAPAGTDLSVFSDADIACGRVADPVVWLQTPTPICGLDPSFASGGDQCVAVFGKYGLAKVSDDGKGRWTIQFDAWKKYTDDASVKDVPRTRQIARRFAADCRQWRVEPRCIGVDCTVGGHAYADAIQEELGGAIHRVEFGGAATERPYSAHSKQPAKDKFANKATELWVVSREFLVKGHIRGITVDVVKEMRNRKFEENTVNNKQKIETKRSLGKRGISSPNHWDAACVAIDVCRDVLGAVPGKVDEFNPLWNRKRRRSVGAGNRVYIGLALRSAAMQQR